MQAAHELLRMHASLEFSHESRSAFLTHSLDEPTVRTDALGAIVTFRRPWVVLVHDAILLTPPVQRRHEEDEAEHPPDDRNLHAVELLQRSYIATRALRPLLLEAVVERKFHDLTILWTVDSGAT